ncbi:MAG: DUF4388 domain-containing protein [Desulfobulbus sp.]
MNTFKAVFEIIHVRNCPLLYSQEECFALTDKAVELPLGRSSCLILVRELTGLLFALMPHAASQFTEQRNTVFTCGGCTGLIKFKLSDKPLPSNTALLVGRTENKDAVMSGRIEAIVPAELFQVFHMHQKTGRLILEFEQGSARVTFREGGLLAARFDDLDNQEAIYAMLSEKKGTFYFIPGLPDALMKTREIGDFMMILMEGLRRLDEEE